MKSSAGTSSLHLPIRAIPWRVFALAIIAALAVACAGTREAQEPSQLASVQAGTPQSVRVSPTLEWTQVKSACKEARRQAKLAASRECSSATSIQSERDSCECSPGSENSRKWQCSAEATYLCADGA